MEQLQNLIQTDLQRTSSADLNLAIDENGNIISIVNLDDEYEEANEGKKSSGNYINRFGHTRDEAFSYLQEIARTPLFTPQEEKDSFVRFRDAKERVDKILNSFPKEIIDSVRFVEKRRGAKRKDKRWWNSMNIPILVDRIRKEFNTIKAQQNEKEIDSVKIERLRKLCTELTEAGKDLLDVRDKLGKANLLLVASIAKRHNFRKSSLSFLDLMQEGSIGLMKAIDKFDPERGYRFSTYATWWIMQTIKRALDQQNETIRIPCYIGETHRSIKHAITALAKELEREPDLDEVAEEVGMSEGKVIEILQSAKGTISLDTPLSESIPETTISDLVADETKPLPEEQLLYNAKKELLDQVLGTLKDRESLVIKLRYGLEDGTEYTLAEIGQKLGISRERVRQIEVEALRKLRHPTRTQNLKELF